MIASKFSRCLPMEQVSDIVSRAGVAAPQRLLRSFLLPALALVALTLLVACGSDDAGVDGDSDAPAQPASQTAVLQVVASTSILADWVREVGGDRVEVQSLVPRQTDPHGYRPGARDVAAAADADLVFVIGANLEEAWLEDLLGGAVTDLDQLVNVSDGVPLIPFEEFAGHADEHHQNHADEHDEERLDQHDEDHADEHDEDHADEHDEDHADEHDGHDHGEFDPHFWMDPALVRTAVRNIERALAAADAEGFGGYSARADTFLRRLDELDDWIRSEVSRVPRAQRLLLTTHDAFGYFGKRYGLEVVGVVLPGGGTESAPSPRQLAELTETVRERGVLVVFGEESLPADLTQAVASESGAEVVGGLLTGSLGAADSDAGTYVGMMRHNVGIIVEALTEN